MPTEDTALLPMRHRAWRLGQRASLVVMGTFASVCLLAMIARSSPRFQSLDGLTHVNVYYDDCPTCSGGRAPRGDPQPRDVLDAVSHKLGGFGGFSHLNVYYESADAPPKLSPKPAPANTGTALSHINVFYGPQTQPVSPVQPVPAPPAQPLRVNVHMGAPTVPVLPPPAPRPSTVNVNLVGTACGDDCATLPDPPPSPPPPKVRVNVRMAAAQRIRPPPPKAPSKVKVNVNMPAVPRAPVVVPPSAPGKVLVNVHMAQPPPCAATTGSTGDANASSPCAAAGANASSGNEVAKPDIRGAKAHVHVTTSGSDKPHTHVHVTSTSVVKKAQLSTLADEAPHGIVPLPVGGVDAEVSV